MELKEYQKKTLEQVKRYLESLAEFKEKNQKAIEIDPEYALNFPLKAWEKTVSTAYWSKKNPFTISMFIWQQKDTKLRDLMKMDMPGYQTHTRIFIARWNVL